MTTASDIQILWDGGNKRQAFRLAESQSVEYTPAPYDNPREVEFGFADGSCIVLDQDQIALFKPA